MSIMEEDGRSRKGADHQEEAVHQEKETDHQIS